MISQGLKVSNNGIRFSSCRASDTGKSRTPAEVFLLNIVPKKTIKNKRAAKVMMIPPASASIVVGTHSGVNNSFFGFR